MSNPNPSTTYTVRKSGQPFTSGYRVYLEKDNTLISTWHDIPLYCDESKQTLNMVVEIPRWSNAKMEIAKDEFLTPIKQDIKKGKPRYVPNIFPHKGYPWNYGAFPQTWEDPSLTDPHTQSPGDDDPLDVCDLSSEIGYTGQIKPVKVLGALAILDEGETDWKIIVVDVRDPLAAKLNEIEDVERYMPGFLETMKYWFTVYKVPDGKGENEVGLGGRVLGRDFANTLIHNCHQSWKTIINEETPKHKASLTDLGIYDGQLPAHISQTYDEENAAPSKPAIDKSYFFATSSVRVPGVLGTPTIVEVPSPAPTPAPRVGNVAG